MSFSGHIEDFPVIDILQYIHASRKSGVLNFQKKNQISQVFFLNGQIIRTTHPGMNNLGDLLLLGGQISRQELNQALIIQKNMPQPKPLGIILEETGKIDHPTLRKAITRQIEETIYELLSWEDGSFRFELVSQESKDDISMAPDDVIPPEETDTQFLLLEAVRIFDEAKNRGEDIHLTFQKNNQGFLQVQELEIETSDFDLETVPMPHEDLKMYLSLIKKIAWEGTNEDTNQSISLYFLKMLSECCQRAILFLVRRNELLGLGGFGKSNGPGSLNNGIKNLRIPLENNSILDKCIEKRASFIGVPPAEGWLKQLHQKIGVPGASQVMVLPMAGVQRVICLVYGEGIDKSRHPCSIDLLEIAAGQAGLVFENISLRKQMQKKSH